MPTIKDVVAKLGFNIEKDEDFDEAKFMEHVGATYTPTESILKDEKIKKQIVGKVLGSLTTKMAQEFDLKNGEVDGKPLEEIFGLVKTKYSGTIAELTKKATEGNDEKVHKLTEELGAFKSKLAIAEEGVQTLTKKYDDDMKAKDLDIITYKVKDKIDKTRAAVNDKFTEDYHKNELVKTGFDAHISNNFEVELDGDDLLVRDKKTKEIVKSKAVVGKPATLEEVLLSEAEAKGVLKKNNAPQKKLPETQQQQQRQQNNSNNNEDGPRIHPNALKRTQR